MENYLAPVFSMVFRIKQLWLSQGLCYTVWKDESQCTSAKSTADEELYDVGED